MENYIKKVDLQPLETKITFLEKLVCSRMEKLRLDETNTSKNVSDDTLKIKDVMY